MDTSLVKLIGPWARIIDPNIHSSSASRNNKSQAQAAAAAAVKTFTGFSSSGDGKSQSQATRGNPPQQQQQARQPPAREKIEVNFAQLHKKPSCKFIRGVGSQRENRASLSSTNRKLKRDEVVMARRELRAISPISDEDSFNMSEEISTNQAMESKGLKNGGGQAVSKNNNAHSNLKRTELLSNNRLNNNMKPVSSSVPLINKPPVIAISTPVEASTKVTDKRKMQLLEYKKTKMELAKKFENKPRPFKPGGVVIAPAAMTKSTAMPSVTTNRNKVVADKVPSLNANAPGRFGMHANSKEESERRITRAMAKGAATDRGASSALLKPAINQMKNLNIHGKQGTMPNKLTQHSKSVPKPDVGKLRNIPTVMSEAVPAATVAPLSVVPLPAAPEKITKPKSKINPIDHVYRKYSKILNADCDSLDENISAWKSVQASNIDIPNGIQDDIDAAIGQANLLLKSKLPQFAQLLGQYIAPSTDKDTPPILDCDLEGWWDVAKMQVQQVLDAFRRLEVLQKNNWSDSYMEHEPVIKKNKPKPKKSRDLSKPPATSNFRIFLLNKKAAEVKSEDMKLFDAGHFQIQSPASSPAPVTVTPQTRRSTRLSGFGPTQINTPTGNGSIIKTPASQRRLSLVTMSMKSSMGSLYRVGVIPEQQQDDVDA